MVDLPASYVSLQDCSWYSFLLLIWFFLLNLQIGSHPHKKKWAEYISEYIPTITSIDLNTFQILSKRLELFLEQKSVGTCDFTRWNGHLAEDVELEPPQNEILQMTE